MFFPEVFCLVNTFYWAIVVLGGVRENSNLYLCPVFALLSISTILVVLVVKNPPANIGDIETWVWSMGQQDPLKKGMATLSSILAWRIPWTDEPGGLYSPWGHTESNTTEATYHKYTILL